MKPSIFNNEQLARLGSDHFRLFTSLWCQADRKGRLEDRPDQIESKSFPFKFQKVNLEKMLDDLANCSERFIDRYERNGKRYILVNNFLKHNYPHLREKDSTIPAPGKHSASTSTAHLNPESPILNPESPILNPESTREAFESLWSQYPKPLGKKEALRHFMASVKTPSDVFDIRRALANCLKRIADEKIDPDYIPHGKTWFYNWRDDLNYKGVVIPSVPKPLPKPPEVLPPDPTEADLVEMHRQKVSTMGTCRKACEMCEKTKGKE